MAVDGEAEGGKPPVGLSTKTDDLAEYRLDEYDDDVDEQGAHEGLGHWSACSDFLSRDRSIHEHQGIDLLPR